MSSTDLRHEVRTFISRNYYVPDVGSLNDDTSLLRLGIVDSTGVLQLVTFLEDLLQITIEDDEIVPENLDTIAAIVQFAGRKRRAATVRYVGDQQ